jgi:hypothetical protein
MRIFKNKTLSVLTRLTFMQNLKTLSCLGENTLSLHHYDQLYNLYDIIGDSSENSNVCAHLNEAIFNVKAGDTYTANV